MAAALLLATPVAVVAQETRTLDTTFVASQEGVVLAGSITAPAEAPPTSLAVLLPVAGPTDRDLTLGPHTYFEALAEGLARGGVATLRFDERGSGSSGGDLAVTGLEERAADACRALETLRAQYPAVARFGFIGLSEGGGTALLAADRCGPAGFLVLLSTPVLPGRAVMEGQLRRQLALSGLPEEQRDSVEQAAMRFLALVDTDDPAASRPQVLELLSGPYGSTVLPPYGFVPTSPEARTEFALSAWYRSQVRYDVREVLARTVAPILAVYGDLDRVLDPAANAALLRDSNPEAEVHLLPGLNHLMQEAETGWPLEYARLETSLSDQVIARILEWLEG